MIFSALTVIFKAKCCEKWAIQASQPAQIVKKKLWLKNCLRLAFSWAEVAGMLLILKIKVVIKKWQKRLNLVKKLNHPQAVRQAAIVINL